MLQAVLVILAFLAFGVWQIVPLIRQKIRRHIIVYLCFWTASLILSLLLVFKVELPSFERFMMDIIKSITGQGGGTT